MGNLMQLRPRSSHSRATWALLAATSIATAVHAALPMGPLDLTGYAGGDGAISVQRMGDTVDPYFGLQALLLAHEFGLDVSPYAKPWAQWLIQRQKPDATFDRFCRAGPVWAPCKTADADDALMALWLRLLETMPSDLAHTPRWSESHRASSRALAALIDPSRGVYLVSPVYQHGLLMDNLEVWSYRPACVTGCPAQATTSDPLAQSILQVFWDGPSGRFLVSTQPEQKWTNETFYPTHVTQVYPLLFDFQIKHTHALTHYRQWMKRHRTAWLAQAKTDFSWGLVALIALKFKDLQSAGCWMRETASARGTSHWIVTDEVTLQVLLHRRVPAAGPDMPCG